mmetsp:Transcript_9912/g.36270  ORF Transcript_9912/g.36270 Transcript_9912/m.36270 type:complete len:550 (+) Transcript_9912:98-1747(+)
MTARTAHSVGLAGSSASLSLSQHDVRVRQRRPPPPNSGTCQLHRVGVRRPTGQYRKEERALRLQRRARVVALSSTTRTDTPPAQAESPEDVDVRVLALVPDGEASAFRYPPALDMPVNPSWQEVMKHLGKRISWQEPTFQMQVYTDAEAVRADVDSFQAAVSSADMVVMVGMHDSLEAEQVIRMTSTVPTLVAMGLSTSQASRNYTHLKKASRLQFMPTDTLMAQATSFIPWSQAAKDAGLLASVEELFGRGNPNDLVYSLLVLIDACVAPVKSVSVNSSIDGEVLMCMIRNCGSEVFSCVTDPACKSALDCLENCGLNDQVCSYRCITSYESPKFAEFALCNLQKHNCLKNFATRPDKPVVLPMSEFNGEAMTHELAERLLYGWLDHEQYSWKVVCGQNPAYDYFPCQHQIFYEAAKGKSFWYDPIFKVETMEGEIVWRHRHYRVKRAKEPGTFMFSVLDNGVTSSEFWRVVDVEEEYEWAVLYYSGAASPAGQAYNGAVFCTRDGNWPAKHHLPRITESLRKCGIELWELYEVDNCNCEGAPLKRLA